MRLTLIIASIIVSALVEYSRLLAVAHDASHCNAYQSPASSAVVQSDLASSQTN
jgi:hypothetical protein